MFFFFFQAEDGIRDVAVTGVQTCALPISDALELAARLADEPADVLGQRVGLAHEGPELLCDDRQHALGALRDPPEGEGGRHGRHERQHQRDGGEDQERLGPEGHGVLNYWWKTERKAMKLEA